MNPADETLAYRVQELEKDVNALSAQVTHLMWAIVSLTISLAGSAVVFALTVISLRGQ